MSYILDSLKKAEQKRRASEGVEVSAAHLAAPENRRSLWPRLLVPALLLNAALLVLWGVWQRPAPPAPSHSETAAAETRPAGETAAAGAAGRKSRPPSPATGESVPVGKPSPGPAAAAKGQGTAGKGMPAGVSRPDSGAIPMAVMPPVDTKRVARKETAGKGRPVTAQRKILSLDALPPSVRRTLPPLELSLHFYAADPGRRMVRLDGKLLRQGDRPAPGLTIREITRFGVVLETEGYLFEIPRP